MSASGKTYVIFDGDNDMWAYRFMRGWNSNQHMTFNFDDAHDIKPMTYRASDEDYVKRILRERMRHADQVIVLIGESTRNLYKYVRWEIDLALELRKPIIAVNLNEKRQIDEIRCPPILKNKGAVHIPFKAKIIEYALNNHPSRFRSRTASENQNDYRYLGDVYTSLGL